MTSLWQSQAAHHLLALREILVRHDENWKAYELMERCVPYVCAERRDVVQAREDQQQMVMHAIDAAVGKAYYDNNPGDAPFEQQYGLHQASDIFRGIPRFAAALQTLVEHPGDGRILDLACNDGILAQALDQVGTGFDYSGLDLSQACIDRALARGLAEVTFRCGSILDVDEIYGDSYFDLVVMFEVLEHVLAPEMFLEAAWDRVAPGGKLMVSTPLGAVERGELPHWDRVEPKGHIWAFTDTEFEHMLRSLDDAKDVQVVLGEDGVMIGTVSR